MIAGAWNLFCTGDVASTSGFTRPREQRESRRPARQRISHDSGTPAGTGHAPLGGRGRGAAGADGMGRRAKRGLLHISLMAGAPLSPDDFIPRLAWRRCPLPGSALRSNVTRGNQQMQQALGPAMWDFDSQSLLSARPRAELGQRPIETDPPQLAFHEACRLSESRAEQHLHRKADLECGIAMGSLGRSVRHPRSQWNRTKWSANLGA